MPAEGRENPLLKKGNSDAFFREKYLTKNIADDRADPGRQQFHLPVFIGGSIIKVITISE